MKFLLTLAAWALVALSAHARTAPDEAAKTALAQKRYDAVIAAYAAPSAAGLALHDIDHYRLAIAHNALDQPLVAWRHLQAANELNAAGTYASSTDRLNTLKDAILAGCDKVGRPKCTEPPTLSSAATPAPAPTPTAIGPAPALPVPAASTAAADSSPASTATNTVAAVAPTVRAMPNTPRVEAGETGLASTVIALQAAAILMLGWICWSLRRQRRRAPVGREGVERLRDDVATLIERLGQSAEGSASELFGHLRGILPYLEREAGRVAHRASGDSRALSAQDRQAVDLVRYLTQAAPDVLRSSKADIEAVFRRALI